MKLICATSDYAFCVKEEALEVVVDGRADRQTGGSAGAGIKEESVRDKLHAGTRAWDFLALALSATAADLAGHCNTSSDGWTREFDLDVSVSDPDFWNTQHDPLQRLLSFLTTDRWQVRFVPGGLASVPDLAPLRPTQDCVALLSGGLDSFIGCVDLGGRRILYNDVSQRVRGDADNQRSFAHAM